MLPPRLILACGGRDDGALTPFERRAARRLTDRRERDMVAQFYETDSGGRAYRFARVDTSCVRCHTESRASFSSASTNPTTAPATARTIGLVAVDIPSQIETSQLLLNRVFILTAGLLAGTLAIVVFYL